MKYFYELCHKCGKEECKLLMRNLPIVTPDENHHFKFEDRYVCDDCFKKYKDALDLEECERCEKKCDKYKKIKNAI